MSQNAATSNPANIVFVPLTDNLPTMSNAVDASISIGALSVQPGGTGVILAGTGDPNDALDSYYGGGILRSADGGTSWTLIQTATSEFNFLGEGFAGFAWSTVNPQLVVAAVSQAYEGVLVGAQRSQQSYEGLYYSIDSGATWSLAQITDLNGQDVQGPLDVFTNPDGNAATSVVWNPFRGVFIAAERFHGYYQSTDGAHWTRLAAQPGTRLTTAMCPTRPGSTGSPACPMYRGTLAVNPLTGDTFAWTVDVADQDQGIWQDVCAPAGNACGNPTIAWGKQWNTAALESDSWLLGSSAAIPDGTYNLALAAVPSGQDTILLAGDNDIWKCSLAMGCTWRNTTNATSCMSAQVAEYQHAVAWNPANPLELFVGNDGGLWRSTDGIAQSGPVCSASDATHFQNLNGGLGSLAEVDNISAIGDSPYTMMLGLGANGTAGVKSTTGPTADWPQILTGEGGPVAIDPANPDNWYVNNGPGVSIHLCSQSQPCTPYDFGATPAVTNADVNGDGLIMLWPAPFLVDAVDSSQLLIGTCRVWRGAANGIGWTSANAVSPMFDGNRNLSYCNGNALVRSMAAMGISGGGEVVYVGMYGILNGGATIPGHVLTTRMGPAGTWSAWEDLTLNPVVNDQAAMNFLGFDISSLSIDPHDPTGNTVYVTVAGIPNLAQHVKMVYRSTDGGAHWSNIQSNLPVSAANSVVVDPQDANTAYIATDAGVYITSSVTTCGGATACWSPFGSGLPDSPVVALSAAPATTSPNVLVAGTFGRGVWQIPLVTAGAQVTTAIVAPTVLDFGIQGFGITSVAQTVTLTNTGGIALRPGPITVTGDFSETDNCANSTLNTLASCAIQVKFRPTQAGSRTGQLSLSANVAGGNFTVTLTGTGATPGVVNLKPPTIDFGQVQVGSKSNPLAVTAENTGGTASAISSLTTSGPFVVASNSCGTASLAANSDCQLQVQYVPTTTGPATGLLTMVDDAGTQTVQLTGTGGAPPTDTLSSTALIFGGTIIGQSSSPQTVTLTNSGDLALTSISASVSGPFRLTNDCSAQLAANSHCSLSVVFAPTQSGKQTGTLTVSDKVKASQTVSLSGTGLLPPVFSVTQTSLTFAPQEVGIASTPSILTVTNSGGAAMSNVGFQITGPAAGSFSTGTTTCGTSLEVGASCTVQVVFTPSTSGGAAATLTISSSTVGVKALTVPMSGTGLLPPAFTVNPTSLSFPATQTGVATAPLTLMVTNSGDLPMANVSFQNSGVSASSFATATTTCGAVLAAGATCTANVVFTPVNTDAAVAILTISSSTDRVKAVTVPLSGAGQASADIGVNPAQLNFGSQQVGVASAPSTLTVTNSGEVPISNLGLQITGLSAASFSLGTKSCGPTLAAGASCKADVVFTPSTSGGATAILTVSSGTSGVKSFSVPLIGTGQIAAVLKVSPVQLSYAAQALNEVSSAQTVTVSNTGGGSATGLTLTISGPFSLSQNTCAIALAAGASCTTGVAFTPMSRGAQNGALTVSSSNAPTPATVALSGIGGLTGAVQITPSQVNFPTTGVGSTSSPITVTMANSSAAVELEDLKLAVSAGFKLANSTCPAGLAAGASCTVDVAFAPSSAGEQSGTLTLTSSVLAAAATVPLTGMGFDFQAATSGSSTQTVSSGQTATYLFTLTPSPASPATFTLKCGTLPSYAACSFSPSSVTVAADSTGAPTLHITTSQSSSSALRPAFLGGWQPLSPIFAIVLLPLAWRGRRRLILPVLGTVLMAAAGMTACSSSGGGSGGTPPPPVTHTTPAGTYSIPVTISASGVQHTVTLTLVVD